MAEISHFDTAWNQVTWQVSRILSVMHATIARWIRRDRRYTGRGIRVLSSELSHCKAGVSHHQHGTLVIVLVDSIRFGLKFATRLGMGCTCLFQISDAGGDGRLEIQSGAGSQV
jgi:hypothetical protein